MPDPDRFNSAAADSPEAESAETEATVSISEADEKLLRQIRKDFSFFLEYWSENREQGAIDMTYVAGDPWTAEEKQKRKGRPILSPDEISQFLKQVNNNSRQNATSIKVLPKGEGATDKDALRRAAIIRGIEYQSNAQAAYTTAFEGATGCFMGAWRLTTKQMNSGGGFAVEPRIKRIANPFTVLLDPEAREADFSDQNKCFVTDIFRKDTFASKFPKAVKTSFSVEDEKMAPDWFKGDQIIVAEYWCRTAKSRKKLKVRGQAGETTIYRDELKPEDKPDILDERDITEYTVTQYLTNGVEILEKNEWPGSWIPIIPVMGEEIYVNDAGQSKRMFLSLIRRARTAAKMLCFIASQEAEEFAMAPRAPIVLWEGQEMADKKAWENLNDEPRAYVRLKAVMGPNNELLPPPGRLPFEPNIQVYEAAYEQWRRGVQASMGINPLPTAAQRQNEKSGIALERIQTQEAIGAYHFTDNLNRAKENTGRQLNELITRVMDTPRHVPARQEDDTHELLQVMSQEHAANMPPPNPEGELDYLITDRGEFDVTISTGPSYQSQREQAQDFADTLIKELAPLAQLLPPQSISKLFSLAIQLKDVGSIGDKMAEIIDPEDQTGQQLAQAQQQLALGQQMMAEMKAENDKLKLERAGKIIDNQFKAAEGDKDREVKVAIAEISAKSQQLSERMEFVADLVQKLHVAAHERGMQAEQHGHEHELADKNAATAALTQQADQQHQVEMAQQQPESVPG